MEEEVDNVDEFLRSQTKTSGDTEKVGSNMIKDIKGEPNISNTHK